MVRKPEHDQSAGEYFETCFMNPASALNKRYGAEMDYDTEEILKLTYTKEQAPIAQEIITKLDKLEHVRIGTYNRNHGEKTIIVVIKRNCDAQKKIKAAYKIMQCARYAIQEIREGLLLCNSIWIITRQTKTSAMKQNS